MPTFAVSLVLCLIGSPAPLDVRTAAGPACVVAALAPPAEPALPVPAAVRLAPANTAGKVSGATAVALLAAKTTAFAGRPRAVLGCRSSSPVPRAALHLLYCTWQN